MSLASYEPAEPLLPAPTSVFSATRRALSVLVSIGGRTVPTQSRGGRFVRYRRDPVYQDGVTRRAKSARPERVVEAPLTGCFVEAPRSGDRRTRTSRRSRAFCAAAHVAQDRARMSGARMAQSGCAQAGWSRAHHERHDRRRARARRGGDRGPTISSQRPKTAPTTSARPAPRWLATSPEHADPDHPAHVGRATAVADGRGSPRSAPEPGAPLSRPAATSTTRPALDAPAGVDRRGEQHLARREQLDQGRGPARRRARRTRRRAAARAPGRSLAAQLVGGQAQGQGHAALLALGGVGPGGSRPSMASRRSSRCGPTVVTWRRTSSRRRRPSASIRSPSHDRR